MNEIEYNRLQYIEAHNHCIGVNDLQNRSARTLLLGYDKGGYTYHTYIEWQGDDPVIKNVIYGLGGSYAEFDANHNDDYIPNKRLYPECCDMEFCTLLVRAGMFLPFTTPDWERPLDGLYYGKRVQELSL